MQTARSAKIYAHHTLSTAAREIRLLTLESGRLDETIICHLSRHCLDDIANSGQQYNALSYTWGDSSQHRSIVLEGHDLPVTDNLFNALRQLRRHAGNTFIWIDAMCINQEDVEERNKQVAMMDSIYKSAKHVLVWLGDANEPGSIASPKHKWDHNCQAKFTAATQSTRPPWWQRAWTLQEYVLANSQPRLCFGGCIHSVDEYFEYWSENYQLMQFMPRGNITSSLRTVEDTRKEMSQGGEKPSLLELLQDPRLSEATNPRDFVYSTLGLISEKEAGSIHVDYAATIERVFSQATFAMIVANNSLEVVKHAGWEGNAATTMPSWAMTFPMLKREYKGIGGYPSHWPHDQRGNPWPGEAVERKVEASLDGTGMQLTLRVSMFDQIKDIMFTRRDGQDRIHKPVHHMLKDDNRWNDLGSTYINPTACENGRQYRLRDDGTRSESYQEISEFWRMDASEAGSELFARWEKLHGRPNTRGRELWDAEGAVMYRRGFTMFETGRYYIGVAVGNLELEVGDTVVLPHGCSYPMLIRRQQTHYRFLGFVYIHGIMHGALCESGDGNGFEKGMVTLI